MVRQRYWRRELVEWAACVKDQSYRWGETDCLALVREALHVQFGEDLFPAIPHWFGPAGALRMWVALREHGGYKALFTSLGAVEVPPRQHPCWPMGSILVGEDEGDTGFPAFGIYVEPITVQSDQQHGVCWAYPQVNEVQSAWLFEQIEVAVVHG